MKRDRTYNGHPSFNAWNIALWIGNDEGLYNFARECARARTLELATARFMEVFDGRKTPDSVPYTKTNVRRALGHLFGRG